MPELLDFVEDLPLEEAQPYQVFDQHPFIAIVQWDGGGEMRHWVLIPKDEVESFISKIREVAA